MNNTTLEPVKEHAPLTRLSPRTVRHITREVVAIVEKRLRERPSKTKQTGSIEGCRNAQQQATGRRINQQAVACTANHGTINQRAKTSQTIHVHIEAINIYIAPPMDPVRMRG
ncbi:MAG: hypothetical protein ACOX3F_04625 [Kiritimatiellia bacterium]|jgi:hypothetical protein